MKNEQISDLELINKHLEFTGDTTKYKDLRPLVLPHISLVREHIRTNCSDVSLQYDPDSEPGKSYNIQLEGQQPEDVYLLTCKSRIVLPILMKDDKIISITTVREGEGSPAFFIFYKP